MTSDRERDGARRRLVRLADVPGSRVVELRPTFVPDPPDGGTEACRVPARARPAEGTEPDRPPAEDGATGAPAEGITLRGRALASAVTAYTAAHGHPLEHPTGGQERPDRRWATPARVAAAAVLALTTLCATVVLHAVQQTPPAVADVAAPRPASQGPGVATDADAGDGAGEGAESPSTPPNEVVVHVVGQVLTPGVVVLPAGSRVADAVEAAGGATPEADLAALNLARVLQDGEQVAVRLPGEPGPAVGAPGVAAGDGGGPGALDHSGVLDLNAADEPALDALPGIGPVLAERIVDWRTRHGAFSTVDELREVTGIGASVLEGLRHLVRV